MRNASQGRTLPPIPYDMLPGLEVEEDVPLLTFNLARWLPAPAVPAELPPVEWDGT